MSVTTPRMYGNFYQGLLTDKQAEDIIWTISQSAVPQFKHKLFDFPKDMVVESLTTGKSIRQMIHEQGIDYTQYIGELSDKQTVGAAFMYLSPRSILGDGVGSGKTAEFCALLNTLKQTGALTKCLYCVESTAVGQAVYEVTRFTGLRTIEMPTETPKMRKRITKTDWSTVDVVVMGHGGLRSDLFSRWLSMYLDGNGKSLIFNTFVLDESSVIKNKGTKVYDYTYNICRIVDRAHFLNATTFETCILDIYNQLDIIEPEALPKVSRIEREYCTYESVKFWGRDKQTNKPKLQFRHERSGYKNQEAFKTKLKLLYFGRPREESKHKYSVEFVETTQQQQILIGMGYRYNEVLNCPSEIEELKTPTTSEYVPKLARLVDLLTVDYSGQPAMVYCFHIKAQWAIKEELEKAGRKPVVLNGSTPKEVRHDIQEDFNSGKYDVIITNIQKSLNLSSGKVCIIYSQIGNPAKMEQVRGRIDRNVDDEQREFVLMLYRNTGESDFFMQKAAQRAKDARELTIDAKTAVDYFMESLKEEE